MLLAALTALSGVPKLLDTALSAERAAVVNCDPDPETGFPAAGCPNVPTTGYSLNQCDGGPSVRGLAPDHRRQAGVLWYQWDLEEYCNQGHGGQCEATARVENQGRPLCNANFACRCDKYSPRRIIGNRRCHGCAKMCRNNEPTETGSTKCDITSRHVHAMKTCRGTLGRRSPAADNLCLPYCQGRLIAQHSMVWKYTPTA